MADISVAGIMRAGAFSPNHIVNDATIFNLVCDQLRKRGCTVNVYTEEQFCAQPDLTEDVILNMCRAERSVELLKHLEDTGKIVINSGYGIENCTRDRMARIFCAAHIPYPETLITATDQVVKDKLLKASYGGCWVKRGDWHSQHHEDVAYARHPAEAQDLIQEFFLRGIKRAVINRHIEGEQIKFYGVAGTNFFHWFHSYNGGLQRPGAPAPQTTEFDVARLKAICSRCAELLDVKIYGGDALISPEGQITIIDFDDFPSMAPCRPEAASIIARFIVNTVKASRV